MPKSNKEKRLIFSLYKKSVVVAKSNVSAKANVSAKKNVSVKRVISKQIVSVDLSKNGTGRW